MPTRIAESDIIGAPQAVPVVAPVRAVLDLRDVATPVRAAPAVETEVSTPTRRLAPDSGVVGASDLMPRPHRRRGPAPMNASAPAAVSMMAEERHPARRLLDVVVRAANDNRVRIAAWGVVFLLLVVSVLGEAIDRSFTNVIEVAPPVHGNGIG